MKLSRDGAGLGIFLIVTATRSNAMKYSTYNNFKNKIAGYLFDESDVHVVVGRSSYRQSEIKGRALIKYNGQVSVMQGYVMVPFAEELEYNRGIEDVIARINGLYPNRRAPRIPVLPEQLDYARFLEFLPDAGGSSNIGGLQGRTGAVPDIWLGLDKETVEPRGMEDLTAPFVIVGETARGKTNALKLILAQLLARQTGNAVESGQAAQQEISDAAIYLFDSRAMELYEYKNHPGVTYVEESGVDAFLNELGARISSRGRQMKEAMAANPGQLPKLMIRELPPCYVLVDDWDNFVEMTKAKAMLLAPLLVNAVNVGISFILTAHSSRMKGFDEVSKFAKSATDGLLLGNPGTTGLFGGLSGKELPQMKDGLLFHNGAYVRIRVPRAQ